MHLNGTVFEIRELINSYLVQFHSSRLSYFNMVIILCHYIFYDLVYECEKYLNINIILNITYSLCDIVSHEYPHFFLSVTLYYQNYLMN